MENDDFENGREKGLLKAADSFAGKERDTLKDLLLIVSTRIDNTGGLLWFVVLVPAIGFCVAVHYRLFEAFWGIDMDTVRHAGIYAYIIFASIVVPPVVIELMESGVYRKYRDDLVDEVVKTDLTLKSVIADALRDKRLKSVGKMMARDNKLRDLVAERRDRIMM